MRVWVLVVLLNILLYLIEYTTECAIGTWEYSAFKTFSKGETAKDSIEQLERFYGHFGELYLIYGF